MIFEVQTGRGLQEYSRHDPILTYLDSVPARFAPPEPLTGDRWLRDSAPKRMMFERIYGEYLRSPHSGQRMLDVGGGFSSLTPGLAENCDYHLLDIGAHITESQKEWARKIVGPGKLHTSDWHRWEPEGAFDLIVANDLFPNADQRLEMFLDKYLPRCRRLMMTLTFHPRPRFYEVRRVNAEETLWFMAWDQRFLRMALSPYAERMGPGVLEGLERPLEESLYPNGRQVVLAELRGDLAPRRV